MSPEVEIERFVESLVHLAQAFELSSIGCISFKQCDDGTIDVYARPYLTSFEVKQYFGGMGETNFRHFKKECPPSKSNPDRWHVEDLVAYRMRREASHE